MDIWDIAISITPLVGDKTAKHLVDSFGSAKALFDTPPESIVQKTLLRPTIAENIASRVALSQAQSTLEYCLKNSITPIAATDAEYPELLKRLNDNPHILYLLGNHNILNQRLISFVGTRKCSPYGERICYKLIERLAQMIPDLVVVSGLAYGIDSAAHRAALNIGVPTIAVVPTALPNVAPSHHRALAREIVEAGGAIISEITPLTPNRIPNFVQRNRIIAGVSTATIIVEATERSGTMRTAKIASSYGFALGAIPGRITDSMSQGCNRLIASHEAFMVNSAEDIVKELGWYTVRESEEVEGRPLPQKRGRGASGEFEQFEALPKNLQGLVACFRHDESLRVEELEGLTGLGAGEIVAMLMELELEGVVRSLPGSRYERLIAIRR